MRSTEPADVYTWMYGGPAPRPPARADYRRHADYLGAVECYLRLGFVDHSLPKSEHLGRTLHRETGSAA